MSDQAKCNTFQYNPGTGWGTHDTQEFATLYVPRKPSCYEVLRVMQRQPLFLEEHFARLEKTMASIGETLPFSLAELKAQIQQMAVDNAVENYNVKLILNDFAGGTKVYLFFTPTSYPSGDLYEQGVATNFLHIMRDNPQAKIINQSLRDQADALMKAEGLFEAVLVDDDGNITEGSKSNLFFIKNGALYTSPAEGVLLGVTRQRIIRLAEEAGIPVHEEVIPKAEVSTFQAAFISGTSPKVLPIATMGDITLDVKDPTLRKTMDIYDGEITRYLSQAGQ